MGIVDRDFQIVPFILSAEIAINRFRKKPPSWREVDLSEGQRRRELEQ